MSLNLDLGATADVSDEQGDKGILRLSVGHPVLFTSVGDTAAQSCESQLGSDPSRAMVVPVHVSFRLTSSIASDVTVGLNDVSFVQRDGSTSQEASSGGVGLWALESNGQPQCIDTPSVDLGNIAPNQTSGFDAWIVVADAVTPADPSGTAKPDGALVGTNVQLEGGATANFNVDPAHSPNVVTCDLNNVTEGSSQWVAVFPETATYFGCKAGPH